MSNKRVFIAINLPEEVKEELKRILQEIRGSFPFEIGKWVKKDNLHLTLLFLGRTKHEKLLEIIQKTKQACENIKPFKLKITKVLYGPPKTFPPRLIWIELAENSMIEQIAKNLGANKFLSHITVCRIKAWQWKTIEPEEQPAINQELDLEFKVKSIDIMESKLHRTGPEYIKLESIYLN